VLAQRTLVLALAALAGLLGLPGVGSASTRAASAGTRKVELRFFFEGSGAYTLTDHADYLPCNSVADETESATVSWTTSYPPVTVYLGEGPNRSYSVDGEAFADPRHQWSYTSNAPGCGSLPAAHVHCDSDLVYPASQDQQNFADKPPKLDVESQGELLSASVEAIGYDFFVEHITGTPGVCNLNFDSHWAMGVLLGNSNPSLRNIAVLFREVGVIVPMSEVARLAAAGAGKARIQRSLQYSVEEPCVDQYHPVCTLDLHWKGFVGILVPTSS